jgi:hypothetical protein
MYPMKGGSPAIGERRCISWLSSSAPPQRWPFDGPRVGPRGRIVGDGAGRPVRDDDFKRCKVGETGPLDAALGPARPLRNRNKLNGRIMNYPPRRAEVDCSESARLQPRLDASPGTQADRPRPPWSSPTRGASCTRSAADRADRANQKPVGRTGTAHASRALHHGHHGSREAGARVRRDGVTV